MASTHSFFFILLTFLLLFLVSPIQSSSDFAAGTVRSPVKDPKQNLTLYYETQCPYCANYIINGLHKAIYTDIARITNLRLVPWGNARIEPPNTVVCQHGVDECYYNMVEACAIEIFPDSRTHFQFVQCLEEEIMVQKPWTREQKWKSCAQKQRLRAQLISDCISNGKGEALIWRNGNETERLIPPHQYVPWVVLNGAPLWDDFPKFIEHICKAYKGQNPPQACKGKLEGEILQEDSANQVCFADKTE